MSRDTEARLLTRVLVVAAMWILFAQSDHGDNALSIAIGGTIAILTLAVSEPLWVWLWRQRECIRFRARNMKRLFTLKGTGMSAFEQDVRVTLTEKKDVPVEIGDEVLVLVQAQVANVYGENGAEVDLKNPVPVKVVEVIRRKKEK